jgi:hypothetical protein
MDENIITTAILRQKAEPLCFVEPLDCTCRHFSASPLPSHLLYGQHFWHWYLTTDHLVAIVRKIADSVRTLNQQFTALL